MNLFLRAIDSFEQFLCKFKNHPGMMRQSKNGRLFLRCADCGWESTGWQVTPQTRPARRIIPLRLVRTGPRKVA